VTRALSGRALRLLLPSDLTARRAGVAVAVVTVLVTLGGGFLIWIVDRDEFPTVGRGLWWALQTVTTVGYGDAVPSRTEGRIIAAVVMLVGIGFLAVTTAAITAVFLESARRRLRREDGDTTARLDEIAARLDRLESSLRERG
jgi:voltage-gated potassium channel